MKNGALIISAGSNPRRDSLDPTQIVGSISIVQRLIMTFHLAGIESILILVSEADEEKLSKFSGRNGVELLREERPQAEFFDNNCLGLSRLKDQCEKILVTPVDIPLFSVDTVKKLLDSGHSLVAPSYKGNAGHPLLIGSEVIPKILPYKGDHGLRGAVQACGVERMLIEVDDPGVYVHSDQFEACDKIVVTHNREQWRPAMRLQIAKDSVFFGPGTWQLLSLIESTGSVRWACEQMRLSYSKAWKILNSFEEQAGFRVLIRKHGGRKGGETLLTEQGKIFLEQFERCERECRQAVSSIFEQYFGTDHNG